MAEENPQRHARRRPRRSKPTDARLDEVLPLYSLGGPHYLGYRVVLAARLFDRRIAEILQSVSDFSLPQWRVLSQLGLQPTGTVRSLANGAAVQRSEASRAIGELEAMHLVERRENSLDLRQPLITLTPRGREAFESVRTPLGQFIETLVDGANQGDLDAANRLLMQITMRCLPEADH